MKKITLFLTMLVAMVSTAMAQTVVAHMQELAAGATNENKATLSTSYETNVEGGAVYEFRNSNYLGGISSNAVLSALNSDQVVTVAAWVYVDEKREMSVLGYGGQNTGVKFALKDGYVQITTKYVKDYNFTGSLFETGKWQLIAWSFPGANSSVNKVRVYVGATDGQYWSDDKGRMVAAGQNEQLFAIGSGNQEKARDAFDGQIANVTVITSSDLLQNSVIAGLIGEAPVEMSELSAAQAAVYAKLDEVAAMAEYIGTGIGEYSSDVYNSKDQVIDLINWYRNSLDISTLENCNTAMLMIQGIVDAFSVNMPQAGDLIAFKSAAVGAGRTYCAGKYVKNLHEPVTRTLGWEGTEIAYNHTVLTFEELDPATTPSAVFMVEENGNGGLILKNMHTQQYVISFNNNSNRPTHMGTQDKAVDIRFTPLGKKQFNVFGSNGTNPMHAQEAYSIIVTWEGGLETPSAWYIEEVETFVHTLNVTSAEHATLMLGFDATIPAGVTCCIANDDNLEDGGVKLVEVEGGVLPANEEVVVIAEEGNYDFTYVADANVTANEANMLEGSLYTTEIAPDANTTYYVLANVANVVGLYRDELANGNFRNNANKAYLPYKGLAQSAGLRFEFGTTGIENVENAVENAVYYDLSGRRVANPVKGLYIVNGKKVLVK